MNADEVVEKIEKVLDRFEIIANRDILRREGLALALSGVLVPRDEQSTKTPNPS